MTSKKELLNDIVENIEPVDKDWVNKAKEHTKQLVMPTRALGRLHDLSEKLCGIQKTLKPSIKKKAILIMAGDHGIAAEGVSAYPQEVTGAMVATFLNSGAGINAIAGHVDADVWVVDMGIIPDIDTTAFKKGDRLLIRKVARGTKNIAKGPAMSEDEALLSVLTGFKEAKALFEQGVDIIGTGDMGIANTTPSAAIGAVITQIDLDLMAGYGTGVDEDGFLKKKNIIQKVIDNNRPNGKDGIDILAKIGGFEIGGIAGIILAAAHHSRPVVIDGFISTAGALVAYTICPTVRDYIFAGHCSEEQGHKAMLNHLNMVPILDMGMRLGEGTGAALAMGIIEAAQRMYTEVFTFEEAGVAGKKGDDNGN